jgi:hypothetical protein
MHNISKEERMNYISITIAVLVALMDATIASTVDNPFFGSWKVVSSIQAPWYDGEGALPKVNPEWDGKTIIFAPHHAKGSRIVECEKPVYTLSTATPESLFEGSLKNPVKDATVLGFKGDKFVSMFQSCDSIVGDMELNFHMVDHSTILIGINNRIYKLKRQRD